jgi:hypothetical protein
MAANKPSIERFFVVAANTNFCSDLRGGLAGHGMTRELEFATFPSDAKGALVSLRGLLSQRSKLWWLRRVEKALFDLIGRCKPYLEGYRLGALLLQYLGVHEGLTEEDLVRTECVYVVIGPPLLDVVVTKDGPASLTSQSIELLRSVASWCREFGLIIAWYVPDSLCKQEAIWTGKILVGEDEVGIHPDIVAHQTPELLWRIVEREKSFRLARGNLSRSVAVGCFSGLALWLLPYIWAGMISLFATPEAWNVHGYLDREADTGSTVVLVVDNPGEVALDLSVSLLNSEVSSGSGTPICVPDPRGVLVEPLVCERIRKDGFESVPPYVIRARRGLSRFEIPLRQRLDSPGVRVLLGDRHGRNVMICPNWFPSGGIR